MECFCPVISSILPTYSVIQVSYAMLAFYTLLFLLILSDRKVIEIVAQAVEFNVWKYE